MRRILAQASTISAAIGLLLALADIALRTSPAHIYAGEPFAYWSHVNVGYRPALSIGFVLFFGAWLALRRVTRYLGWIRVAAVVLLMLACCVFSWIAPLLNATTSAIHLQSVQVQDKRYHLYYQNLPRIAPVCDHVLVACDAFGLVCEHVEHWRYAPTCLGSYANIELAAQNDGLSAIIDGEVVKERQG